MERRCADGLTLDTRLVIIANGTVTLTAAVYYRSKVHPSSQKQNLFEISETLCRRCLPPHGIAAPYLNVRRGEMCTTIESWKFPDGIAISVKLFADYSSLLPSILALMHKSDYLHVQTDREATLYRIIRLFTVAIFGPFSAHFRSHFWIIFRCLAEK